VIRRAVSSSRRLRLHGLAVDGGRERTDVTLRLNKLEHLFDAPPASEVLRRHALPVAGVDHLLDELRMGSSRPDVRTTIVLPASEIEADTERRVADALDRYCSARIERIDRELRALRREGLSSSWIGVLLLALGLMVSEAFRRSSLTETVRVFFGEGLFVVVAWVGIWYPLDLLIYARRPYIRERRLLEAIRRAEVTVAADVRAPEDA
jgi:hypothetical protein